MITNAKRFTEKHKYAIFIFLFIFVYNFVVVRGLSFPEVDRLTYHYYLVDFSMGFCTKLLPGAIFNALFSEVKVEVLNIYFGVIYHVFLLAVSFVLEKFINAFNDKEKLVAFVIVMFFITGPATFAIHTYRFGMIDTYWLFFTLMLIVAIQNKVLRWFVPVLFVLGLMIHISAMVSFIPVFALFILLEATREKSNKKIYLTIFSISVLTAVLFFVYMILYEGDNVLLSFEEYRELVSERNQFGDSVLTEFYDYALYRLSYVDRVSDMLSVVLIEGDSFIASAVNAVWAQIYETIRAYKVLGFYFIVGVNDLIVSLPVVVLLYKYAIKQMKKDNDDKLRKFVWLCMLILIPVMFVIALLCSPDIPRWFGHCFILLFSFVMYDMYRRKDETPVKFDFEINNRSVIGVVAYFAVYMCCILDPYC